MTESGRFKSETILFLILFHLIFSFMLIFPLPCYSQLSPFILSSQQSLYSSDYIQVRKTTNDLQIYRSLKDSRMKENNSKLSGILGVCSFKSMLVAMIRKLKVKLKVSPKCC